MPRKFVGFPLLFLLALVAIGPLAGCSDDDDPVDPGTPDDPSIVSVVITPESAIFTSIGEDLQFQAEAFDAQGAAVDTVFTWQSSQPDVVLVESDGNAIATGPGTAEIYATSGGVVDTAAVTVDLIGAPVIEWVAGGDGNWEDGANWNGGEVPGEGDFAVINSAGTYTVTMTGNVTTLGFLLGNEDGTQTLATGANTLTVADCGLVGGAALDCDGAVYIQGDGVWTGGSIFGNGVVTVQRGATLNLAGESLDLLGTIENEGSMVHADGSAFRVRGGRLNNPTGGLVELHGESTISVQEDGRFTSGGSIEKTMGMEEAAILSSSASFISRGNLEVETGSLWISGGELRNVVDISEGARLRLTNDTYIPSIITRGDGIFEIGGRVEFGNFEGQTISLDHVVLNSTRNPALVGIARVRIDGSLVWQRGIVGEVPEFITQNGSVTTFETNGTKGINGTTWTVIGRVEGDSNVDLVLHNDARILIEPRAVWSQSTGGILREGLNGSQGLSVLGTFEKTDEGSFILETRLDCAGTLDLPMGNLAVKGEFRLLETGLITGGSLIENLDQSRLTLWESPSAEMAGTLRPGIGEAYAYFIINGKVDLASTFRAEIDIPTDGDIPTEKLIFLKSTQVLNGSLEVLVHKLPPEGAAYQVVSMHAGSGQFEEITGGEVFYEIIEDDTGVLMKR